MKRYRRKVREEPKPQKRRWLLAGGALAVVAGLLWFTFGGSHDKPVRPHKPPAPESYDLTARSWADMPAPPPLQEPELDPEEVERQRWLAEQWKNMDIAIAGDR